jgi:regulator of protease activity HflC (stomatin/prohibitin superfamily)
MAPPKRDISEDFQIVVETLWIITLALIVLVVLYKVVYSSLAIKRVVVYDYQKGLKYSKGRYWATLDAGQYWILSRLSSIVLTDMRAEFVTVPGQDVLSADGVTLKVSLAAQFQIADPHLALSRTSDFRSGLYLLLQMAVREIIGQAKIEELMENRAAVAPRLMEMVSGKASEMGLKLLSADIKDIMFPGEMKQVFGKVVKARKEGLAALERARGETAALRNLANAARQISENPNLLQLRALQALSDSSGSTLVLGLPNGVVPVPGKKQDTDRDASGTTAES